MRGFDITGMRSGKLVAVKRVGTDKHKNALWLCRCDCGNEKITTCNNIRRKNLLSCGCMSWNDIAGKRFGRLTVIERYGVNNHRNITWKCICDCGNVVIEDGSSLRSGHTKSCGCLMTEIVSAQFKKHGGSKSRLYVVWGGMIARCTNPSHTAYKNYGGRGISVCDEWKNDFAKFQKWAYENGYDENAKTHVCTIDRINNDGNYGPNNCRWVDMKTQCNNTQRNKKAS